MQTQDLIAADEFCINHNIEVSFIITLQKSGLIELTTDKESRFIPVGELQKLEKIVRLYNELDINLEGIEVVDHLLHKILELQGQIRELSNKLRMYE